MIVFICVFGPLWAQDPPSNFQFSPDPQDLGKLEQGATRHVVLNGRNISGKSIELEEVLSQNVGSSNFHFPKTVAADAKVHIEFDFNTADLEGPFTHRIILVEKGGKPDVTLMTGTIESPILFSQQMLDAGFVTPESHPQWTLYAWNPQGKPIELQLDSATARLFSLQKSSVKLDTRKFDDIREGGEMPGLKLILTAKGLGKGPVNPKIRSINQVVSLKSATFPKATPELLVVGYWK
ncbi:MAG TPA: hypothetical protein VLM37_02765 [Fibrobacteraceae bacterium]|nr:hypothetical protein [Fibrobacteraceae bacterium]